MLPHKMISRLSPASQPVAAPPAPTTPAATSTGQINGTTSGAQQATQAAAVPVKASFLDTMVSLRCGVLPRRNTSSYFKSKMILRRLAMLLSIGLAGRKSGCTPPTIRYYESIGLLPAPPRSDGGRRSYGPQDVARLVFIRRARDFGLGIAQVRELLAAADAPATACAMARPVVEEHVRALRAKRAELKALEAALGAILTRCDEGCRTGTAGDCAIFNDFHLPAAAHS